MRAVEVRYTVRPEFADQNKANIRKVMAKLKGSPIDGMMYSAYTLEDGVAFGGLETSGVSHYLAATYKF